MKKIGIIIILFATMINVTKSQSLDSTALVLIDIQYFYFPGGAMELTEPEKAAEKAKQVLDFFRKKEGLVVHVRHEYNPGGEINKLVAPLESETVFSKKEVNSFLNTGLDEFLKQKHIKKLVLCGMQTHMCLEGATRAAHDLGYECTVIEDACATRDLKFKDVIIPAKQVHYSTLATLKNYAKIVGIAEYLKAN